MVLKRQKVDDSSIPFWEIPKIWSGNAYVLGGGCSLKGVDLSVLEGKQCLAVNHSCLYGNRIVPFTCFGDNGFVERAGKRLDGYEGTIITNNKSSYNPKSNVKICKRTEQKVERGQDSLCWYGNTGLMGIELAIKFGADSIYILGYDYKNGSHGLRNFYLTEKDVCRKNKIIQVKEIEAFKKNIQRTKWFNEYIRQLYPSVRIINCNPDSVCDVWPKVKWSEVCP